MIFIQSFIEIKKNNINSLFRNYEVQRKLDIKDWI